MKYFKKFEGEKIYLSPLNIEDIEKYVYWLNDRRITDNLGRTFDITTLESEKEWFLNANRKDNVTFAIVKKETDELLGNCSIMHINRINRSCTFGIFIGEEENRNKGYGKETLELLLKYSFDFQNMHSVDLEVFSFNKNAIKCYEKTGFKTCGVRHDAYFIDGKYHDLILMEMLESDYRKRY